MFLILEEIDDLYYYWGEYKTLIEASDKFNELKKEYPDIRFLVAREGQFEIEEEDCWYYRDFC